jgi:hypothetical protein
VWVIIITENDTPLVFYSGDVGVCVTMIWTSDIGMAAGIDGLNRKPYQKNEDFMIAKDIDALTGTKKINNEQATVEKFLHSHTNFPEWRSSGCRRHLLEC